MTHKNIRTKNQARPAQPASQAHGGPLKGLVRASTAVAVATLALSAGAADGRWTEGFGQGNLEYFIDAQGMRLLIGCPTQEGSADASSDVSLTSISTSKDVPKFAIKVAGRSYDGPFTADSRVGENNFIALLEDLRKGDAVVSFAGKSLTFPKSNAAQVLPVFGKKGFDCNLG